MPKLGKISQLIKVLKDYKQEALALYFIAIIFDTLIGLILQSRSLVLQQQQRQQRNMSYTQKLELQTEIIENLDLVVLTSQIHRACGAIAMCYYSLIVAACTVYGLPYVIPAIRVYDYIKGSRIVAYLAEPELENERISTKIEKVIRDVIDSNTNLEKIVIGELEEGSWLMNQYQEVSLAERKRSNDLDNYIDSYEWEISNHYHNLESQRQRGSLGFSREQIVTDRIDSRRDKSFIKSIANGQNFRSIAVTAFFTSLQDQLKYLIRLKSQKHKIWHSNEELDWANKIQFYGKNFDLAFTLIIWTWSVLATYLAIKTSLIDIKSSEFGSKYQNITAMDCLSVTNTFIGAYLCSIMAGCPYQMFFISILDIFRQLDLIKSKIASLAFRLRGLKELNQKKQMTMKEYELMKRDVHFECDRSAIELYIYYRIFRDEMKASMRIAEQALSQNVSFVLLVLIPILPYMSQVITGNVIVLSSIMFCIFFAPNLSLLICGAIHAHCIKNSKRISYFIALAEAYNMDEFGSTKLNDQSTTTVHKNYHADFCLNFKFDFDFEYHLHGFLTYHTLFLWRQLAKGEKAVQDHFICKLFGAYEVNYRTVIKYNFWIISITLIMLSGTLLRE